MGSAAAVVALVLASCASSTGGAATPTSSTRAGRTTAPAGSTEAAPTSTSTTVPSTTLPPSLAVEGDPRAGNLTDQPMDWLVLRLDDTVLPNRLYATNRSAMPIDLATWLSESINTRTEPGQPARTVVPALSTLQVATFGPDDASQAWGYHYETRWELGDPTAVAAAATYELPLAGAAADAPIIQGPGGAFSHTDRLDRYAIDYGVPSGTPVLAARRGTVATIEQGFTASGTDESFARRGNAVRVSHDDGTWAIYLHLDPRSARVRIGDHVEAGQILALSGNTGFSSRPHLHLAIRINRDHVETSIPFSVAPD